MAVAVVGGPARLLWTGRVSSRPLWVCSRSARQTRARVSRRREEGRADADPVSGWLSACYRAAAAVSQ